MLEANKTMMKVRATTSCPADEKAEQIAAIKAELAKIEADGRSKAENGAYQKRVAAFIAADKAGDQDELKKMIAEFAAGGVPRHELNVGDGRRAAAVRRRSRAISDHDRHPPRPSKPAASPPAPGTAESRVIHSPRAVRGWLGWAAHYSACWPGAGRRRRCSGSSSLFTDWRNMAEFGRAFLQPNFHEWDSYLADMIVTIQIAIWGTALAVVFGVPFAILSVGQHLPAMDRAAGAPADGRLPRHQRDRVRAAVRRRGRLGPFAGVMALFIHNPGVFSKLFSEAVEAIDPRPVEGIRATGARRIQEVIFGVIPQVMPLWSSFTLYRLETNVRSATTLGIVGAGGIGQTLYESIRSFQYAETAAQIIIVVATVMVID